MSGISITRSLVAGLVLGGMILGALGGPQAALAAGYTLSDAASCSTFLTAIGASGTENGGCYVFAGTLGAADSLTVNGSEDLRPQGGGSSSVNFTNNGTVNIDTNAGCCGGLYNAGVFDNEGTLNINNLSQNYSTIINHGIINVSGPFYNQDTTTNYGTINILNGGSIQNNGTISLACGATVVGTISGNPVQNLCAPPVITPQVSGSLGSNGWYVSSVTVNWSVVDNGSAISSETGCGSSMVTSDTSGVTFTCTATNAGGTTSQSVTIKRDATPPTITAQLNPAQPASTGWYNQSTGAPSVSFNCNDATSGIPAGTCPSAYTFGEGANQNHTASVKDAAGNSASTEVTGIDVDLTPPTVTYSGNASTYTVDQQVSITCTPADSLSGVASTTCQNITGPAYSFGLGAHPYSATATDTAGNTGNGTTSFTVTVTSSSLQTLVNRFCTDPSVAASLDQDVNHITTAPNVNAKAGALQGFAHLVQAQTGKSLTSDQASILITLADAL